MSTEEKAPETKRQRFHRVGTRRLEATLDQMRLLANLGNRATYEYTEADVEYLLEQVDAARAKIADAFVPPADDPRPEVEFPSAAA